MLVKFKVPLKIVWFLMIISACIATFHNWNFLCTVNYNNVSLNWNVIVMHTITNCCANGT